LRAATRGEDVVQPTIAGQLGEAAPRDRLSRTPQARLGRHHSTMRALGPLLLDVAVPVALYYVLTGLGIGSTPALLVGGFVPFARSARSLVREGTADYLALMVAVLFVLSLALLAFTGSAKFMLAKESVGTALVGLWCLGSAWARRPMTFYTARPLLTKGRPVALACWDRLAERSDTFRSIQRRLAIFWGLGLLVEAAVRIGIVEHYSVHTAAGLVNVAAVAIVLALCLLSGPLGGVRLQRLLGAAVAAHEQKDEPS
jgi:hypothetical protein